MFVLTLAILLDLASLKMAANDVSDDPEDFALMGSNNSSSNSGNNSSSADDVSAKIVGGQIAKEGQFPYSVNQLGICCVFAQKTSLLVIHRLRFKLK